MRKIFGWIILLSSISGLPIMVLAEDTPYNPAEDACINSNKNQYYYNNVWNPITNKCECIDPESYIMVHGGCVERSTVKDSEKPISDVKKDSPTPTISTTKKSTSLTNDNYSFEIDNYKNLKADGEVSLDSGSQMLQSIKTGADEAIYLKKLHEWEQQVRDAEQKGSFKDASSKDEFIKKQKEENDIKLQILNAEKLLGFSHVRVLESTNKNFKFEYQSKEYQAYWKQPVDNIFDDTTNAIAFNAASKNASGYASQIGDLKRNLANNYPSDWKTKYLNVPAKPVKKQSAANIY